jgi:hypothetical protein
MRIKVEITAIDLTIKNNNYLIKLFLIIIYNYKYI